MKVITKEQGSVNLSKDTPKLLIIRKFFIFFKIIIRLCRILVSSKSNMNPLDITEKFFVFHDM